MPWLVILSTVARYLPFVFPKWQIACMRWILYISTILLIGDKTEYAHHGPPVFFLAGDSTTAAQNCCGGGWGNGFLSTLQNGALGTNFGRNGATTATFVDDGEWDDVLESVSRYSKASFTPYVTIAFGHNDQATMPLEQFKTNLYHLAHSVQHAGGHPILVTPLSQRNYDASSGLVIDDLGEQRDAVLSVAAHLAEPLERGAFVIDLNAASRTYLDRIGRGRAWMYELQPGDVTHLNAPGGLVFGNLVSGLIGQVVGRAHGGYDIKSYTRPNETIWEAIVNGEFIFPTP